MEVKVWEEHSPTQCIRDSTHPPRSGCQHLHVSGHLHFWGPARAAVGNLWVRGVIVRGSGGVALYFVFRVHRCRFHFQSFEILPWISGALKSRWTPSSVRSTRVIISPAGCGSQRRSWWRGDPGAHRREPQDSCIPEFKDPCCTFPSSDISAHLGLGVNWFQGCFILYVFPHSFHFLLKLPTLCFMAGKDCVCREICDSFGNDCYLFIAV